MERRRSSGVSPDRLDPKEARRRQPCRDSFACAGGRRKRQTAPSPACWAVGVTKLSGLKVAVRVRPEPRCSGRLGLVSPHDRFRQLRRASRPLASLLVAQNAKGLIRSSRLARDHDASPQLPKSIVREH